MAELLEFVRVYYICKNSIDYYDFKIGTKFIHCDKRTNCYSIFPKLRFNRELTYSHSYPSSNSTFRYLRYFKHEVPLVESKMCVDWLSS